MSEEVLLNHANLNALIGLNGRDATPLRELLISDELLHPEVRRLLADMHAATGSFRWKAKVTRRHPGAPAEEARRRRLALGKRVDEAYRSFGKLEAALVQVAQETSLNVSRLKKARRKWLDFVRTAGSDEAPRDELAYLETAITLLLSSQALPAEVRRLLADLHDPNGSSGWRVDLVHRHPNAPDHGAYGGRLALGRRVAIAYRSLGKVEAALAQIVHETEWSRSQVRKAYDEWCDFVDAAALDEELSGEIVHLST